ncbi:MAG TPA: DUF3866 family protein [Solirubrobacteraceae bacterium]|jgi:hypothetical protein|nr:DUF3866 family protein [Solirubrobacteraceae bacterium]
MLKLRPATVVEVRQAHDRLETSVRGGSAAAAEQRLVIELTGGEHAGARRDAIADVSLVGPAQVGDEVIVNTLALDLGLGSGGFDIVHVNLTRGLAGAAPPGAHVMKLCYTSLQHAVRPAEAAAQPGAPASAADGAPASLALLLGRPAAVLALHGQLPALAWAFAQAAPGSKLGYVQTEGGALPGGHSRTVRVLRERGLLAGHLTAGAAFGGEAEAVTLAGALHHGLRVLGWDAAVCGPGPGIVGSGTPLGHGGMQALDSAHVALALGCRTLLVARMSSGERRERHRGISHHTLTVLDLLLEPVTVALPAGVRSPVGSDLRAGLQSVFGGAMPSRPAAGGRAALAVEVQRPARIARHDWRRATIDLPAYAGSALPATTMGRGLVEDPLFFAAALAGGAVLAELALEGPDAADGEPPALAEGAPARSAAEPAPAEAESA